MQRQIFDMKFWFKPTRIIPSLTILASGIVVVLGLVNVITLSFPETMIITLLGLLAVDALSERIGILERIEDRLSGIPTDLGFRSRSEVIPFDQQALHASEIYVLSVSGLGFINRYIGFLEKKVMEGCQVKILLLNPDAPALHAWDLQSNPPIPNPGNDIKTTLGMLARLTSLNGSAKGKCEVRLLDVFLSESIVAVDLSKNTGSMVVEFHAYKKAPSERPHVYLHPRSKHWYDFYHFQFLQAWSDGTIWKP